MKVAKVVYWKQYLYFLTLLRARIEILSSLCHKNASDEAVIEIEAHFEIQNHKNYIDKLSDVTDEKDFISKVKIQNIKQYFYLNKESTVKKDLKVSIESIDNISQYYVQSQEAIYYILHESKAEEIDGEILTKEKLEDIIKDTLSSTFKQDMPRIIFWKSTDKYLITKGISLNDFKEDPDSNIPFRNMFYLYGKKTNVDIKNAIEIALSNSEKKSELKEGISDKATKYVQKVWKEHKVKVKIDIDGDVAQVQLEDGDVKHKRYNMQQRSDGFKQFMSIILTLSSENHCESLKNHIILLDEPEIHLHPSGIRDLRDELIKIGKNNIVLVASHSIFIVDDNEPRRHYIVSKKKMTTNVEPIREQAVCDDEVIRRGFGISVWKELLPNNILIVEGQHDKRLFAEIFKKKFFDCAIKVGDGTNTPTICRILQGEGIEKLSVLLDDDNEGKKMKDKILKMGGDYNNDTVFTLSDIDSCYQGKTVEDLLPRDFVITCFNYNFNKSLKNQEEKSILSLLITQEQSLKQKEVLSKFKSFVVNSFLNDKDKADKSKIEGFVQQLIEKLSSELQKAS